VHRTGAAYIDTAIHEDPDVVCEDPPWYANYEWKRKERCAERGVTAILGAGFDPGVVNAYCALAAKHHFDTIDTIDILDVNAGRHGATSPRTSTRRSTSASSSRCGRGSTAVAGVPHARSEAHVRVPGGGRAAGVPHGHDELHSLSKNIDANSIRFWMGFGDHYINVFTVLRTLGCCRTCR
jgi:saccharopine dehydrogenase-like NADP-dependent oxidoreductase